MKTLVLFVGASAAMQVSVVNRDKATRLTCHLRNICTYGCFNVSVVFEGGGVLPQAKDEADRLVTLRHKNVLGRFWNTPINPFCSLQYVVWRSCSERLVQMLKGIMWVYMTKSQWRQAGPTGEVLGVWKCCKLDYANHPMNAVLPHNSKVCSWLQCVVANSVKSQKIRQFEVKLHLFLQSNLEMKQGIVSRRVKQAKSGLQNKVWKASK